jgi:hypothetical protein
VYTGLVLLATQALPIALSTPVAAALELTRLPGPLDGVPSRV